MSFTSDQIVHHYYISGRAIEVDLVGKYICLLVPVELMRRDAVNNSCDIQRANPHDLTHSIPLTARTNPWPYFEAV
ncbi:hypothetical protein AYI69_g11108 [Smittium culicis]|uniref:Uncharacterized protein n=1 Tax=Smittium culicis TaxID=133412 RepID=A0A1R1X124_9FUNG|nr:hypothetical protein AYI69_g11108 [Smittium culicis]